MSKPKVTIKEVEKVAALARLEITEKEAEVFSGQLSDILGYIDQLNEVDTENTAALARADALSNVTREDLAVPFGDPAGLIDMAPESENGLVKVKAVFDK